MPINSIYNLIKYIQNLDYKRQIFFDFYTALNVILIVCLLSIGMFLKYFFLQILLNTFFKILFLKAFFRLGRFYSQFFLK